jgi:protein-tyrosine phosphatase
MRVWKLAPGLYQSPTPTSPQDVHFEDQEGHHVNITAVVDLEGSVDPDVPQGAIGRVYLYWPIEDEPWLPDVGTLRSVAGFVSGLLDAGHQVLVHCRSGLNRASLVTGRTLVARGMDPREAVDLLRSRRDPTVLKNKTFLAWLLAEESPVGQRAGRA